MEKLEEDNIYLSEQIKKYKITTNHYRKLYNEL